MFIGTLIIMLAVFFLIFAIVIDERIAYVTLACAFISVIIYCVYLIGFYTQSKIPTGRYTYKVEITEETDFNYIYDHYDVIFSDGRVWMIEDK